MQAEPILDQPQNDLNSSSIHRLKLRNRLNSTNAPVFLAIDEEYDTSYVLKLFQPESTNFMNETRFTSLNHPHVFAPIISGENFMPGEDSSMLKVGYTLTRFGVHGDLFDCLFEKKWKFDEKMARTYFHQLIEGLEYLHSNNIAHLDLKLDNLVLDENYQLRIIDFDRSFKKKDLVLLGRGTANYRAPELYLNQCQDPFAADVYSAAIVMFVLLNGKNLPYSEGTLFKGKDLYGLMQENPKEFWQIHESLIKSRISADFKDLFVGMTTKDLEKRFSIEDVKNNAWYNGEIYTQDELKTKLSQEKTL